VAFIKREAKANGFEASPEHQMKEFEQVCIENYNLILTAFQYYAAASVTNVFHVHLGQYTAFCHECEIPDPNRQGCKRSDLDTMFIQTNFNMRKKDDAVKKVDDEHGFSRSEWLEMFARMSIAKYAAQGQSLADNMRELIEINLVGKLSPEARLESNTFRVERLYYEEVDLLLKANSSFLLLLYNAYRIRLRNGQRPRYLSLDRWHALFDDAKLYSLAFGTRESTFCFSKSRMTVIDEVINWENNTHLTFIEFIEALGRCADTLSLPSAEEARNAGYDGSGFVPVFRFYRVRVCALSLMPCSLPTPPSLECCC